MPSDTTKSAEIWPNTASQRVNTNVRTRTRARCVGPTRWGAALLSKNVTIWTAAS